MPKTAEYKIVPGGYRCSNCKLFSKTNTAHYCPSCTALMDNFDDGIECDARAKADYFSVGGSDF